MFKTRLECRGGEGVGVCRCMNKKEKGTLDSGAA